MNWKKKLAAFTILVTITTGIIYIINKLIYLMATVDNLLSNPDGEFYEWRFGKIFYTKSGSGSPVLLIHDLTTYSSVYEWNKVIDELSKTNTVYAVDLLGCGRSEKPNITCTNFLYVQLITDFIKHIVGQKCDIIATGDSGSFALMACGNEKEIINKVILINPSNLSSLAKVPTKHTKALKFLINLPIFGTLLYNIMTSRRNVNDTFAMDYYYDSTKIEDSIVSTYYEAAHLSNPQSKYLLASVKGRYTNTNITHTLKTLNNSIFIITGNGNPAYLASAKQYQEYVPSIEITGIEETKHLPQLENSEEFLEQVKLFLEVQQ